MRSAASGGLAVEAELRGRRWDRRLHSAVRAETRKSRQGSAPPNAAPSSRRYVRAPSRDTGDYRRVGRIRRLDCRQGRWGALRQGILATVPSALPAARLRTYATAYAQVGWPHRMADGLCASREEAVAAFREAFDRVPDNTIDKSA